MDLRAWGWIAVVLAACGDGATAVTGGTPGPGDVGPGAGDDAAAIDGSAPDAGDTATADAGPTSDAEVGVLPDAAPESPPSDSTPPPPADAPPDAPPRDAPTTGPVAQISLGADHSCALLTDATVKCWGRNLYGQLGDGTKVDRVAPTTVPGLADVVQIAVGGVHSCARLRGGTVRCWGENHAGQLGYESTDVCSKVTCSLSPQAVPGLSDVAELSAGYNHTCARIGDGTVKCWGSNTTGALGDDTTTSRTEPAAVSSLRNVTRISVGNFSHTCARLGDGTIKCWGSNGEGELGFATTDICVEERPDFDVPTPCSKTPVTVPGLADVEEVATGSRRTCARLRDGTVKCWGWTWGKTPVPMASKAAQLALGGSQACTRLTDDTAQCWGRGIPGDGRAFRGTDAPPVAVLGLTKVGELATSGTHACARLVAGSVWCWGSDEWGKLGDSAVGGERLSPVAVVF